MSAARHRAPVEILRPSENEGDSAPWLAMAVYCAALATFAHTTSFSFLYDDTWTIVENQFIRDLANVGRFFTADYFRSVPDNNRPVMVVSTMLDYRLFDLHPGGYHMQSVVWHGLNSMLVFC